MPRNLLISSAIVFVVRVDFPSMFSQKYLEENGVSWIGVPIYEVTTRQDVSLVSYVNGFAFEAFRNRILLTMNHLNYLDLQDIKAINDLPDVSAGDLLDFINNISFLHLESVGINFKVAIELATLKGSTEGLPKGAELLSMTYSTVFDLFRINMSFQEAKNEALSPVVVCEANFDGQVKNKESSSTRAEEVKIYVDKRWDCFQKLKELIHDTNVQPLQ